MKPPNKSEEEDMIVHKISSDSLAISGQTFTFDSIADSESTQAGYISVGMILGGGIKLCLILIF